MWADQKLDVVVCRVALWGTFWRYIAVLGREREFMVVKTSET